MMLRALKGCYSTFRAQQSNKIIAELIIIFTGLLMASGIIFYSYELYMNGKRRQYIAWFSSGGFVLLTIPISVWSIILHLLHWDMPVVQRYVVRILWMVPIYSVESWLSLRFRRFSIQIEALRSSYESYVIYSFLYFLISTLGDEPRLINLLKEKPSSRGEHTWPFNKCLSPWPMGYEFLHNCKIGVLQYVVIENVLAVVVAIAQACAVYDEGDFRYDRAYLYVCLVSSISQTWALYCMGTFYYGCWEELHPWRPVGKFLCVKLVVFFTWWQSFFISCAADWGMIVSRPGKDNWTGDEIAKGLQDYLICIEMFFFSIAFYYSFSYKDYKLAVVKLKGDDDQDDEESVSPDSRFLLNPHRVQKPFFHALLDSSVPDEVFADLRKYSKIRTRVPSVDTPQEDDELLPKSLVVEHQPFCDGKEEYSSHNNDVTNSSGDIRKTSMNPDQSELNREDNNIIISE